MFTMRLELKTMLRFPSEVKLISKTLFQSKKNIFCQTRRIPPTTPQGIKKILWKLPKMIIYVLPTKLKSFL